MNTPVVVKKFTDKKIPAPLFIGRVTGIQKDKKDLQLAKAGDKVAIKIEDITDDDVKHLHVLKQYFGIL